MNYRTKKMKKSYYRRYSWGTMNEIAPWYVVDASVHINLYGAETPYEEMWPEGIIRLFLYEGSTVFSRHLEYHLGQYKEVLPKDKIHDRVHKTFVVLEVGKDTVLVTTELLPCPKRKTIPLIMINVTMATTDKARDNFIHYATSL